MVIGLLAALAAGVCFAAAGVLQQSAAGAAPAEESLRIRLLADLVRRPRWLAGIATAFASYGFQAYALSRAPLALVQPVIVTELIFAIPVSSRLRRVWLTGREWAGILAVAGGLSAALWGASPRVPAVPTPPSGQAWAAALAVAGGIAVCAVLLGRHARGPFRVTAYAVAAATVMGNQSGLMDQMVQLFAHDGFVATVASWVPYAMTVTSLGGLLLVQSAFQAGPLAVSLPVIDTVEPLVAATVGVFVLGERIDTSAAHLAVLAAGALVLVVGIVVLDSSPAVRALHQAQTAEQRQAAARARREPTGASASCRAHRRSHGTIPEEQLHTGRSPDDAARQRAA